MWALRIASADATAGESGGRGCQEPALYIPKGPWSLVRKRILLCPSCGSHRVHYEAGMVVGQLYRCRDCGYVGSLVVERDLEEP